MRQIHRLTEQIIKAARPREVAVPAPRVKAGPGNYRVTLADGEQVIIRPEQLQPRPDGTTSVTLSKGDHTAIDEIPFGLDKSLREYNAAIQGDDRTATARARQKLAQASKTLCNPMLAMRDGKPVLVKFKNKLIPDGGGLYLEVSGDHDGKGGVSIRRSWVFRYAVPGAKTVSSTGKIRQKERFMGLGSLHSVNLQEVREKARKCRQLLLDGIDPLEHKRSQRMEAAVKAAKAMTFDQARDAYVLKQGVAWRNEHHAKDWVAGLQRYVSPVIGHLPVAEVDASLIVKVLEPIWNAKAVTAQRIRGRIEKILDFAQTIGQRPAGEANPARWRGHLSNVFASSREIRPIKHMAALGWRDLPTLWKELEAVDSMGSKALRVNILTVVRTGELLKSTASEWDLANGTWTILAHHTKRRRELVVPIVPAVVELVAPLLERKKPGERVFLLGAHGMIRVLAQLRPGVTVHGFRSSFRDYVAERLDSVPREVAEACLGHDTGNAVELAYKRTSFLERRRTVMSAWAAFVTGATAGDNVVQLGQRA
jgi:integrase